MYTCLTDLVGWLFLVYDDDDDFMFNDASTH